MVKTIGEERRKKMSATVKTVECKVCHNAIEMKTLHLSKARYCFDQKGYVCEDCLRHKKEHGTFEGRVCLETEKEQRPRTCSVTETEEVKEQLQENSKVDSAAKSVKKKKTGKITLIKKWFIKNGAEEAEGLDEQAEQEDQTEDSDNQENQ